ncbi:N-acetylated-alpha-linked acidic dipeptidase 2,Probable glutamate carboxypeptidase LAMP1,Glutamate carboxypeptidase 2 [Mytilus coruscus]|uniref:N-acetylated-alpha-linked acidic dipeptidase 2,Probable glutamate carboxypeptidase LAMP1,Glutamate carboxypeptidase 2 n=1 Tax=Mytilus coruscus TaxID=42192 RepID=A0A6J8CMP3_MYTCO|nr:N-acetylated-alpha-linked acidic dipeptidase 2,Probable glutamate carboxypeptidase LAMP1,Glutamate carboxypeptidase 2 [Mytilus coruscus]
MFKDAIHRHANRKIWIYGAVVIIVGFFIGIYIIGRFATCPEEKEAPKQDGTFLPGVSDSNIKDGDPKISEEIINGIRADNIREYLRDLSENPHLAGTPFDWEQADKLQKFWTDNELDEDQLIYVNYGRVEDYTHLDSLKINVSGKIVIARYGNIFRGDKANLAYMHGAIGIILYSDQADYGMGKNDSSQVYPYDWWLPASGAKRGTIFLGSGDPLTPGYPPTETAYRLGEDEPEAGLPKIITHPVGYGVAGKILQKVKMRISTANKRVKTYDVIGIIKGAIEPDRYVLLGNHRDAWVFGAIDPSSGTAVMKEVSRVMGQLVPNPDSTEIHKTVYDKWKASFPKDMSNPNSVPRVSGIGSGSDFAPMVQMVGLPSCDIRYTFDPNKYQLSSYPLYHSKYETFKAVDEIMDRDDLKTVTDNLKTEAMAFKSRLKNVNKYNPLEVRQINDQLMLFERSFLDPQGLPGRPYARHILFAESLVNTYVGSSFRGLVDSLFEIEKDLDQKGRWNIVKNILQSFYLP